MKNIIISIFLMAAIPVIGQEQVNLSIVKADSTWRKEIITFPIDWAPGMNLTGFEELRFSPGWGQPESEGFWSYVLSWDVQTDKPLTVHEMTSNLEHYFDGLMKPNHWATSFPEPVVVLVKENKEEDGNDFRGKMKVFDGFHTGKMITKNMIAQQKFCEKRGRSIIIYRLSMKDFDHPIWNELNKVRLKQGVCE